MWRFEHWAGERFRRGRPRAFGNVQLFHWLALDGGISTGHAVFYDPTTRFQGRSFDYNAGMMLQPSGRLAQRIGYQRVAFDHAITRERAYTLEHRQHTDDVSMYLYRFSGLPARKAASRRAASPQARLRRDGPPGRDRKHAPAVARHTRLRPRALREAAFQPKGWPT